MNKYEHCILLLQRVKEGTINLKQKDIDLIIECLEEREQ